MLHYGWSRFFDSGSIYRPGSAAIADVFFTELTKYLEVVALYKCQIVIAGDFNIHVEKDNDAAAI